MNILNSIKKHKGIPKWSFSFLFWNFFFGYLPIGVLFAFLSLLGLVPVTINEVPRYGVVGFVFMLLYIPFVAIMFSGFCWLFLSFGNAVLKGFLRIFNI